MPAFASFINSSFGLVVVQDLIIVLSTLYQYYNFSCFLAWHGEKSALVDIYSNKV